MPEFLRLLPPSEALRRLLDQLPSDMPRATDRVPTASALGRILAQPVHAPLPLPSFARSAVDGFAVRARDTYGASPGLPAYLALAGEVRMGAEATLQIEPGAAAVIHTGGMLPPGADAVVMLEDTQMAREAEVEILKPASVGQHVLQVGEDVRAGDVVLERGQRLRPQEIGGLLALGLTEIEVVRKPRVAVLSTGDEVVEPGSEIVPGQVRDVNSYTLGALVTQTGGEPVRWGILPDDFEAQLSAAREAHRSCQVVVIAAGSSASTRDLTARIVAALGAPGVLVHGVALKPGKPTILGVADGVPVLGLPGNPVSALVTAGLFLVPVLHRLLGTRPEEIAPRILARLTTNVPSEAGREDYVPVRLEAGPEGWSAEPVFGKSNLIFTLVRAQGMIRIPPEATGLPAGAQVEVRLW